MKTQYKKYHGFIGKIISNDLKKNTSMSLHTRFPPEPNGYLHIGHAKSICLNFELANLYNGVCNLRFDDTNPIKENVKYINAIKQDIHWLGYKWHKNICYSSDYFPQLYKYAQQLIKKNLAYVDQLNKDQIRQYRGTLTTPGQNSPYRTRNIQENLEMFEKMKKGEFLEGTACLRAKIDMKSPFMIMRDPVLYRIIFVKHHQTKKNWCIYPMYDFAHCLSDAIEGITHSLCTLEFQDNRHLYNWILQNIEIKNPPKQYEFSRLNLEFSILSKRKIQILIDKKIITGWDDPRLTTLSGLRKKGYTPNAIKTFCNKIGITKQNHLIKFSLLESCIRTELNKTAIRTMAILDPIEIFIYNIENSYQEILTIPNHPKYLELGTHEIIFTNSIYIERLDFQEHFDSKYKRLKIGGTIRLRHAYIIKAEKIEKDEHDNIIKIICSCDWTTLGKKPKNNKNPAVIHWISTNNTYSAHFKLYNQLFNINNPDQKKDFLNYVNQKSLTIKKGFIEKQVGNKIEKNLNNQEKKIFFQFERTGYFCLDHTNSKKNNLIFHRTVSLRESRNIKIN